jgi:hypothetical protein
LAVLVEVVHCAAVSIRLASNAAGRHNNFMIVGSLRQRSWFQMGKRSSSPSLRRRLLRLLA